MSLNPQTPIKRHQPSSQHCALTYCMAISSSQGSALVIVPHKFATCYEFLMEYHLQRTGKPAQVKSERDLTKQKQNKKKKGQNKKK